MPTITVLHIKTDTHGIESRQIILTMRNVPDKSWRENQTTHFVFSNFFLFFKNRAVYEMFKKFSTAGQATNENTIRRMRIACWIPKALNVY
jgi:hypothetical protein